MKYKIIFIVIVILFTYESAFAHVSLIYPNGNLSFDLGEEINIEWSIRQYHGPSTWTLEYTLDNGNTWITIKEGIVESRLRHKWNIPFTPSEMGGIKIIQVNNEGYDYSAFSLNLKFGTTTDIVDDNFFQQREYELKNAYPNPFNNRTVISYYLPRKSKVNLIIYDLNGSQIEVLENRIKPVGKHEIDWIGDRIASGTYFLVLKANNFTASRKIILLK